MLVLKKEYTNGISLLIFLNLSKSKFYFILYFEILSHWCELVKITDDMKIILVYDNYCIVSFYATLWLCHCHSWKFVALAPMNQHDWFRKCFIHKWFSCVFSSRIYSRLVLYITLLIYKVTYYFTINFYILYWGILSLLICRWFTSKHLFLLSSWENYYEKYFLVNCVQQKWR